MKKLYDVNVNDYDPKEPLEQFFIMSDDCNSVYKRVLEVLKDNKRIYKSNGELYSKGFEPVEKGEEPGQYERFMNCLKKQEYITAAEICGDVCGYTISVTSLEVDDTGFDRSSAEGFVKMFENLEEED